jgi:UDP-4-amino-4-deoxy-L-arabinose formyltransferase/UDP-glucuronic acid dehydrogenase (UDP-4-keto-hexauronic acid decarboxylating)
MKFAALGRTRWLLDGARQCMRRHSLVLVGTAPPAPEYACGEEDFAALAREAGCPFFAATRLTAEHAALLAASGADVAISVNWPVVMPPAMLAACRHGVLNAHAGDLPRFRGNATPNWAILAAEPRLVLTVHRMDDGIDSGPLLVQREFPLLPTTYVADVYDFLGTAIPELFVEALDGLEAGTLTARVQRGQGALRCLPRMPRDHEIDWTRPAELIARQIRASAEPFSGAFTFLQGERLTVWKAAVGGASDALLGTPGQVVARYASGDVSVLTGNGVLLLQEVSGDDGRRQLPSAVITTTRTRLGLAVADELAALRRRVASLESMLQRYG